MWPQVQGGRRWRLPTPVFLPGKSQTEEPGRLQSMGSLRVGHDWSDLAAAAASSRRDLAGKTFRDPFSFLPPLLGPRRDKKLLTQRSKAKAEKRGKADHTASPTTRFQDWSFTVRDLEFGPFPWIEHIPYWDENLGHKVSWVFCINICEWLERLAGPSELPPWARESWSHDVGWLGRGEKEIKLLEVLF